MPHRVVRWLSAVVGLSAGLYLGLVWLRFAVAVFPIHLNGWETSSLLAGTALLGAVIGYLLGPLIVDRLVRTLRWSEARLGRIPGVDLLAGALGTIVGLLIAYLLGSALSRIPAVGNYLPAIASVCLAYLGWTVFIKKREDWQKLRLLPRRARDESGSRQETAGAKVLDTSAIIDGRLADLCRTGFIEGTLIIPQFVLDELRHIADSADPLKRARGRRGLDVLAAVQQEQKVPVQIYDRDPGAALEVDVKLVHVARELAGKVVTTDYNLNKVAALRGVEVLNVNELAGALRPVVLPGEEMTVRLIREGNQAGQGVGYLDDGTMVVVEGGKRLINEDVDVEVTSVLQTAAGRMIFGRLKAAAQHAVGRA